MKRIILSVFAAAVTAAWVVPASAADVTFSGQYRVRGEYKDNTTDFNDNNPDTTDFWAQRVRLTANAKATDDVSAKITIQDTRTWGAFGLNTDTQTLATNGNSLDLHEAYLNVTNIFGTPVSLRAGRQELAYGDERLVGAVNWSNNGQAFDAFKLMYSNDAVNVDLFSATIAEDATATNDDQYFHGVYATLKQVIPNNTLDLYFFDLTSGNTAAATTYTAGARLKGAAAGVDYTAEGAYQFGDAAGGVNDISAYAFAVKAGYTLPTPMKIRVGAEYDFATGQDTGETDNTVFNNLFPTNHDKFGIADIAGISWSNISAWSVNAAVDLNEKTRLFAAYWDFSQDEATAFPAAPATAVFSGANDDLGSEIDLIATYKYNNNVTIEAGAARFFAGDAVAAPADDADFAYLQITGNF